MAKFSLKRFTARTQIFVGKTSRKVKLVIPGLRKR